MARKRANIKSKKSLKTSFKKKKSMILTVIVIVIILAIAGTALIYNSSEENSKQNNDALDCNDPLGDLDGDGVVNQDDSDDDGDGVPDVDDVFPLDSNEWLDSDGDGIGDNADMNDNDVSSGKWLFAMDTDNVQYKYQASGIPTLAIIDKKGDVIFYNQGFNSRDQLITYVDSAIAGTAKSLGESIDFTVTTFNNEEFTLSEHRGEVIILDIMGVGCPPCVIQMPELQKIRLEKGNYITILSVDVYYTGEDKQDVIDTYGDYIII